MPTWLTILMLTPMVLWFLVFGLLFILTDGSALTPGIGAGASFTFAFPLCGLWLLVDGLISNVFEQTMAGLLILTCMGIILSAIFLFRRFGLEKRD